MDDTFVCDHTFVHDNTVAYVGFTCIKTYMNACNTYCRQSVREKQKGQICHSCL